MEENGGHVKRSVLTFLGGVGVAGGLFINAASFEGAAETIALVSFLGSGAVAAGAFLSFLIAGGIYLHYKHKRERVYL